jgi:hypothetical protein
MHISFTPDSAVFDVLEKDGTERRIVAGMDGSRRENTVSGIAGRALASAKWASDSRLEAELRLIETASGIVMSFDFREDGTLTVESGSGQAFLRGRKDRAVFVKEA